MTIRIEHALLAALSVAACSSEDSINPDDYGQCPAESIDGSRFAPGVDGLELWDACTVESLDGGAPSDTATRVEGVGERCSTTECEAELAKVTEGLGGGRPGVPGGYYCVQHLIAFADGQVVDQALQGDEVGFRRMVAGVDSLASTAFLARFLSLGCGGIRAVGDRFEVLSSESSGAGCGDGEVWQVVYSIDAKGRYQIIKEGEHEPNSACPGRRPPGLLPESASTSSNLGDYSARLAGLEGASVAAFQQLAAELNMHGAPEPLLRRLRVAAAEEAVHTELMARLAQRFGGAFRPRHVAPPRCRSLSEIARENASEGCVLETWSALVALWQARHAADPGVRSSLRRIARDEVSHAQLSWDLAAWLAPRLSSTERAEVDAARQQAVSALQAVLGREKDAEQVRVAGVPDAAAEQRLFAQLAPQLRSA